MWERLAMTIVLLGLATMKAAPAWADTYTYDEFGRLTCVAFTAGGRVVYSYDDAGNRSQKVETTSGSCPP
jgi:YD repeat-containing protein